MPIDFALDTEIHDIAIKDGDIQLVRGRELHRQEVVQLLYTYAGEWFLDNTVGIDYKNKVRGKVDPIIRDAEIKRGIRSVPGILRLRGFTAELDPQTRELEWDWEADIAGDEDEDVESDFQAPTFSGDPSLGTVNTETTEVVKSDHVRPEAG